MMRMTQQKWGSKLVFATYLSLGLLATSGCTKDHNEPNQQIADGERTIRIRIAGIGDSPESVATKTASTASGKTIARQPLELIPGKEFDIIAGELNDAAAPTGLKASAHSRAATTSEPVVNGVKYRLFLYKNTGASYVYDKSVVLSAGSEQQLTIAPGISYKWVATSYNSTETIPLDRGDDDNYVLPSDTDVLYASSTTDILPNAEPITININFRRLYARIIVELNTMGMFAPMISTSAVDASRNTQSGTVDLTTGAFVGELAAPIYKNLVYNSFKDVPLTGGQQKVAYFYTADQNPENFYVFFAGPTIQLEDGSTRRFGGNTTALRYYKITPVRGKSHRVILGIAESRLAFGKIDNTPVEWARSNLFYRSGYNPYRFYFNNPNLPDPNESFFSFKGHLPRQYASTNVTEQKDPCALVYPAGLWKTPTKAELGVLSVYQGRLDELLNNTDPTLETLPPANQANLGINYIAYKADYGTNSVYGGLTSQLNQLWFYYNGVHTTMQPANGIVTLNPVHSGMAATFWSSDALTSAEAQQVGLATGGWSYIGRKGLASATQPERPLGLTGAVPLDFDNLNAGVITSPFMNIRCTRDASWKVKSAMADYDPNPQL